MRTQMDMYAYNETQNDVKFARLSSNAALLPFSFVLKQALGECLKVNGRIITSVLSILDI